jgi:hypothetical protein
MRYATWSGRVGMRKARSVAGQVTASGEPFSMAGKKPAGWVRRAALAVAVLGVVVLADGAIPAWAVGDGAIPALTVGGGAIPALAVVNGVTPALTVGDGGAGGSVPTCVSGAPAANQVALAANRAAGTGAPAFTPPSAELVAIGGPLPYGTAAAISGETAAVAGLGANQRASVYVFVRVGQGWAEQARIVDPAGADPASLFGHQLALSGDTLAIGDGAEGAVVSSIYIYTRTASAWSLEAHLQPPAVAGLGFGAALALAGDTLAAGVPGAADGSVAGAAWVYVRSGATWGRAAILSAETPAAGDRFGHSVAVAHRAVVVGGDGEAEIFEAQGTPWRRTAVLDGGGPGTSFATSVTASNETAAISDPSLQRVSFYIHTPAGWYHQADVQAPDAATAGFGSVISLSQEILAVGAPGTTVNGQPNAGAVYVFVRRNHGWPLENRFAPGSASATAGFGSAVAASLHTAVVGSTVADSSQAAWALEGLDP